MKKNYLSPETEVLKVDMTQNLMGLSGRTDYETYETGDNIGEDEN